jgi:hypothetical protein
MPYGALADALSAVHLSFVLFVVIGQLLIVVGVFAGWGWVRNPWFRLAHFLAIGIVVFETLCGIECPLTTWERGLRTAAGQEDFNQDASFIGRLVRSLLFYPKDIEPMLQKIYIAFGLLVLLTLVFAPPRLPWRRKGRKEAPAGQPAPNHADGVQLRGQGSSCSTTAGSSGR